MGSSAQPDKVRIFTKSVIWCGKKISADGITHDPKRIQGLLDMPAPVTGQDLQQWVCALNWMRQSLPNFNELIVVLDDLLQSVCKKAGSNNSSQLAKHLLVEHGWGITQDTSFAATKDALRQMVTLAHPDPNKAFCLFPDASHRSWGSVLTQIPRSQEGLPVVDQDHEPLAFLRGAFKGASLR